MNTEILLSYSLHNVPHKRE